MTVYVDELVDWGVVIGRNGPEWCHLTADTPEELHTFAERLGLKRRYASDHTQPRSPLHYDLTRGVRAKALRLGAVFVSGIEQARARREERDR